MANDSYFGHESALYREMESKINRDNVKCLVVLAAILAFSEFLNEIGLFMVDPIVMRVGAIVGIILFLIPVFILFRPLCLFGGGKEIVYRGFHRYLIIGFVWLGTAVSCVTLTHHSVIVMAVPIMMMSQYRDTRKLIYMTITLGTVCVFLGVYGGYFLGCFDANLLHMAVTDENISDLAFRVGLATPTRMYELLTHYVIPRELVILALTLLASNISRQCRDMLARQEKLQSSVEKEMKRANDIQKQIIDGMANLIENRDSSTGEHVKRTSYYVGRIVDKLKTEARYAEQLTDIKVATIVRAAPLHDIGKIVVADHILQKPGKLTPDEYEKIKLHASEGAAVIKNVLGSVEDDDFLISASEIAGGHHEWWNGEGYPCGLKGNDIPLSARIMAVADVFDALVSKRVYKDAIPHEDAFAIIESLSGKQFDPDVVRVFMSLKPEIVSYINKQEP